jgi:uncharacterized protein YkwD
MRRLVVAATLSLTLALAASPAHAGAPITRLPDCANSYLFYGPSVSKPDYRTALLCLINGARAAEGLPALRRSAPLEAVAQAQATRFARTGSGSHGRSLTDITRRFAQHGYRAAAYNEAFGLAGAGAAPYGLLTEMMKKSGVPCSEIMDPRFRDVGIGVSAPSGGYVTTATLELGRKVGTSQPSTRTGPAGSCGHKLPAAKLTGYAVDITDDPTATATALVAQLKCVARTSCVFTTTATLTHARATTPPQPVTLAAGATQTITYTFTADQMTAERATSSPVASIAIDATEPAPYTDMLSGPLPAASPATG